MSDLYQRQIALEETYSHDSIIAGQKQVLDAYQQGRAADVGTGRILLAKAFEVGVEALNAAKKQKIRGVGGKYLKLLSIADPEVLVMAALRDIINACAVPEPVSMQKVLTGIGRMIESESMLVFMQELNPAYTDKTIQYLDNTGTKSVTHRYRTFLAGSKSIQLDWEQWSQEERIGVAKLLVSCLYDATGLFQWAKLDSGMYHIKASEPLEKHFQDAASAARAVVKYPPMLIKPMDWEGQYNGGYLTEWFKHNSPMCGIRFIKKEHKHWVIDNLNNGAELVKAAMNKAQSVPYRINKDILAILRKAVAMRVGILGLPSHQPAPKPAFPFTDDWLKSEATEEELDQFQFWKGLMSSWYTQEAKRVGRQHGILSRIQELVKYQDEERLYFPTFIDWRGRLYFRSSINPQSNDCIKGCLEFAEGKPLGKTGLKWLKIHVANCCGYDKHDPDLKEKWCDDNWNYIQNFINNPFDVDAPEPDTAFTLLQGGLALQEALSLDDPTTYVCHVPVAMDATCSGLQHLSALTRDEVGGLYTNLLDNGEDQKSDIYMRVAHVADASKLELADSPAVRQYWVDKPISRNMAKKPVMTYVYGSKLLSTIQGLANDMYEAGMDEIQLDGKTVFTYNRLAKPVGKALRKGVEDTVPKSAEMMNYLQNVVRKNKADAMRWFSPVGVPVVNWAEGMVTKLVAIRSMGISRIAYSYPDNQYNTLRAANGIVPNFVHSMDSSHLCLTILDFDGQVLPIHDSFATHPSDVEAMHVSLRKTFIEMYTQFSIEDFLKFNNIDLEEYTPPLTGNLELSEISKSRYMFG
ncbi:RNA polymerase [Acinetobacter phage BM12]|nr:RNA polymerase [Acinetobacter phage BM12]